MERETAINCSLHHPFCFQVSVVKEHAIQWEAMQKEMECCTQSEYTPVNLALLLHQVGCKNVGTDVKNYAG